jgi:DNA-binding response OmpR family regulator
MALAAHLYMDQVTAQGGPEAGAGNQLRRVLVIDDELDHAEIIAMLLRRERYVVEVARDAIEGLERARRAPPDLILIDLYMPALDGFGVADRLRADERTCAVPVIFLSACGEIAAQARGVDLDERNYLPKPFHAAELLEMASAALGTK